MNDARMEEIRRRLEQLGGEGAVHLERQGPLAVITLDQPQAANALSARMLSQLAQAVLALEAWLEGVGLILRGQGGRSFCAGSDLRLVRQNLDDPSLAQDMSDFMHEVTRRLRSLPLISVAALEGSAVGGGAEIATACDLRVLARGSTIRFIHASLGLSPGWGGGGRLVQIVGPRAALQVLASAAPVDAERALAIGLVDQVCEVGQAESQARELLAPILAVPAVSARAAKALVMSAGDGGERERALFLSLWGGPAMREAIARSRSGR